MAPLEEEAEGYCRVNAVSVQLRLATYEPAGQAPELPLTTAVELTIDVVDAPIPWPKNGPENVWGIHTDLHFYAAEPGGQPRGLESDLEALCMAAAAAEKEPIRPRELEEALGAYRRRQDVRVLGPGATHQTLSMYGKRKKTRQLWFQFKTDRYGTVFSAIDTVAIHHGLRSDQLATLWLAVGIPHLFDNGAGACGGEQQREKEKWGEGRLLSP